MYEEFFGLKEKPFTILPDSDFLYLSKQHEHALLTLEYGVFEQTGITVLTGEVGSGKTTLVRKLLREIPYDLMTVGLVSNVHEGLGSLLDWVGIAFDLPSYDKKIDAFKAFQDLLVDQYINGKKTLLVIDEAQNMSDSNLEELRMFMNVNADKNHLLQILLVGQPELRDLLSKPNLIQISQRITAKAHLQSLSPSEIPEYICFRMLKAGGTEKTFTDAAIRKIQTTSDGIPRAINVICDRALTVAYGVGDQNIHPDHIA